MIQFIYFPTDKKPSIIYVIGKVGEEYKGSPMVKELEDGRFSFYPVKRCQPYSDELWKAVELWLEKKRELDGEYIDLTKKGLKAL